VSAALLFFFAGHLLESTLVPLELFFEHRNYVPALLLSWPLAAAIVQAPLARWARVAIAVGLIALLAATTHARADAWGHPARLAALWATRNPESARAHATWTEVTINAGFPDRAAAWLRPKWQARPNDLQLGASVVAAACAGRGITGEDTIAMTQSLRTARQASVFAQDWLAYLVDTAHREPCTGLTLDTLDTWTRALADNPHLRLAAAPGMLSLRGRLALQRGQPDAALQAFDAAYAASDAPDLVLRQAALLDAHGDTQQALRHLDRFDPAHPDARAPRPGMPALHARVLSAQHYWEREVVDLRARIRAHAAQQAQDPAE
jgi:tetratricopeptide (TPR) repeat protein